ncbi:STAS domain-containing protein [Candidatus Omnitrophota bacterium]
MVEFTEYGNNLVCAFSGRIDTEYCMKYQDEIFKKTLEASIPVIFDLKKVGYISSMFLRICVRIFNERGAGNISIVNAHPDVKKVFKISKLDSLITIQ